ncbi:MAG: SGNH/GDSL hydrolase family protein [Actinomycetota bacterium]|nr:SGNH/GDSL hydrolase family protein [Actinomycetota bacterium]
MQYVALGDSISIDAYTGVVGGGAASQLARRLNADFVDLTRDGNTTDGVVADVERVPAEPDVVTLTAGGNDLLMGRPVDEILGNLRRIAERLATFRCPVVMNTVYDPTDGDDELGRDLLGLPVELRAEFDTLNRGIASIAAEHAFLLADLETLFHGHGVASADPWYVAVIEPNLAGATAIAERWHELVRGAASH